MIKIFGSEEAGTLRILLSSNVTTTPGPRTAVSRRRLAARRGPRRIAANDPCRRHLRLRGGQFGPQPDNAGFERGLLVFQLLDRVDSAVSRVARRIADRRRGAGPLSCQARTKPSTIAISVNVRFERETNLCLIVSNHNLPRSLCQRHARGKGRCPSQPG